MKDHRVVNTNTGFWECSKCGETFDINQHLPLPVEMGLALMKSWNRIHKHDYREEPNTKGDIYLVTFEGTAEVYAEDEEDAIQTAREVLELEPNTLEFYARRLDDGKAMP